MTSLRHTVVFVFVMTLLMGIVLAAWFTWQRMGFAAGFISAWATRFLSTYVVVVPTVIVVLPIAQAIAGWVNAFFDRRMAGPDISTQQKETTHDQS